MLRWLDLETPGSGSPMAAVLWNWTATAILVVYVLRVERRGLPSILLRRPSARDVEWAFYAWGAQMTYAWIVNLIRPQVGNGGIETITALPPLAVVTLIVTTAVTEEILQRGYPIERLYDLTGQRWIGVGLSALVFVLPHLSFFGAEWLLYQGFGTGLLYALYLWRRNLVACMVLHLLGNAPILIPTMMA
jgi:membrane protease YdiL (CAAX protease family)